MGSFQTYKNIFFLFLTILFLNNTFAQSHIYVKANASGNNSGLDWQNAYTNLQDALSAASSGDTIFVAEGTYYPDMGNGVIAGDRGASFILKSGIVLLGGYKGSEQFEGSPYNVYWRNWQINKTILSGDLMNNDNENISPDEPARSDNSLHVLFSTSPVDSTAELNGFYIEGGNANSTDAFPGAVGGGIYLSSSTMRIKNCTFTNNTALESGGALFANSGALKIKFAAFINNMAERGGAITFIGVDNLNESKSPLIVNSFFYSNTAEENGAGIYMRDAVNPGIFNSVFTGNTLTGTNSSGAGVYTDNKSYPDIINCTFYNNSAVASGGGIALSAGRVGNSILVNNSASANAQIRTTGAPANSSANREFRSLIVQGGITGIQVYDMDPLFIEPGNPLGDDELWGTPDDGLMLQSSSPVIDSGTTYLNTEKSDILGLPRFSNSFMSYGAYEYQRFETDYEELLDELQNGGYTLAFRHGITDHSQDDQDGYRDDLDNCSLQRNLNTEGEEQTKFIGQAIKLLNIPIDTALTSMMCRCWHSAENIAGHYIKTPVWMGIDSNYTEARQESIAQPTRPGLNSVIVTHMNSMEEVSSITRAEYLEGDALVVKPLGGTDFEEIAQITTDTWEKMINYLPSSPTSVSGGENTPAGFILYDNYPNPFNPSTNFEFNIPDFGLVKLQVYDVLGREVVTLVNEEKAPGTYVIKFDASGLASGTYFYKLTAGDYVSVKKMMLLK